MSTSTTTKEGNLQSRLPDPIQFVPEVAEISGAMPIPGKAQHYSK